MSWKSVLAKLRGSRERKRLERQMEEEIRFHLEMSTRRNLRRGLSPREARRQAILQFGGTESFKEEAREEQRAMLLENAVRDIGFSLRMLRRKPSLAIAVILTMALGIGANTAVFSVVNGVLLRPLPLPDPDRIHYLGWNWSNGNTIAALTAFQFEFVAENSRSVPVVATYQGTELHLGDGALSAPVRGLRVSPGFFDVLGVHPGQGRIFDAAESAPGGPPVVVLGDGVWRSQFGAAPGLVGESIQLDGERHRVIGIMPPGYRFPDEPEYSGFLLPLRLRADPGDEGHNYTVIGRSDQEWTSAELEADFAALSLAFRERYPHLAEEKEGFQTLSYVDVFVGDLRETLWILLGAVTLVLLIACGNTAILLLVRATSRQREIAVRTTLGATRGRLLGQLLLEGLVLSLLASVLGLALSRWGVGILLALAPGAIPGADEIGVDLRVLGYTLLVTVVTGLLFGLAAGLPAMRTGLQSSLRDSVRGSAGAGNRARDLLVLAETALAVVLLTGASLLLLSFSRLVAVETGFETSSVAVIRLGRLPPDFREEGDRRQLEELLVDRLQSIPGVIRAAAASNFPLERGVNLPVDTFEEPERGMGDVEFRSVTSGYLETLGISLLRGRDFDSRDGSGSPPVAIVNESLARRLWPEQDPVGRTLQIGHFRGRWLSPSLDRQTLVVGIVADVREIGLQFDPKPTVLVPRPQFYLSGPAILLRSDRLSAVLPVVREAIQQIDGRIMPEVEPMRQLLSRTLVEPRFRMVLIALFAASALLLAGVGIYGVVAAAVEQKTPEIGLRMALGATRTGVAVSILARSLKLLSGGVLVGILLALGLGRFLSGVLYGTTTTDPWAFALVIGVLLAVGGTAGIVPARRAARLDPAEALRRE